MINRILLLIIFTCSFSSTLFADDNIDNYLKEVATADSLIKKGDYKTAETRLKEAIEMQPENPMNVLLMSNIGLLRHYSGNDSAALVMLDSAVAIAPSSTTVRSNRAKVLASAGRVGEAFDEYTRVTELDSTLVEPRFMRFMLQFAAGELNGAKSDLEYMKRNFPEAEQTYKANTYIYMLEGKFAEAIPMLDKLIKIEPTSENYGRRALCNLMTENLNEASADLNDAIRLDPMNGELYLYRAILNKKRFRPDDAAADVKKAEQFGISKAKIKQFGLN